jgi:molybdenum ABC transporter molybdate-binding protein
MRQKFLSLFLLIALLVMPACTPQAAATEAPIHPTEAIVVPANTEVPPTPVPPTATPEPKTLTVFAAASLTESFGELGTMFEAANPGVTISYNFAGSQQLAEQLAQGAEADVFASASKKYMDAAVTSKRVIKFEAKTFVTNRLVVVFPKDNPAGLVELKDLAKPGLKLDLADKAVPVGQYSLDFLDKANKDETFGTAFKDDVLKNVVSYEDNVKAVVTKVSLGEADAGIVYVTDITKDIAEKVGTLEIPDALNSIANYPIAAITDSKNPDLAKAFVDLILSPDGQAVMAKYAFHPAVTGAETTNGYMVTDALGRAVRFEKSPQKIVLAGKALFMVADAVYLFPEAGKRVVALGSTQQGSSSFIPMIDSTFADKITLDSSAGVEQIAATQPDCVIMKSTNASSLGKALEAAKIPVVYLDFETPEQYPRDLKTLGQLFENPDQAAKLTEYFKTKAEAVTSVVSGLTDDQKPSTLVIYYNEKDGTIAFNVPPMTWMQTLLVSNAGGTPVWKDANPGSGWTKVSLEQIAAWNPDVIFVVAYFNPVNDVVTQMKADSKWKSLTAVKNNKIYGFATDVYSWDQPDTRWILGLNWVAGKLHPDLFPGLDMTKQAEAFYQDLYGMDDASFQKNIVPLFTGDIQ